MVVDEACEASRKQIVINSFFTAYDNCNSMFKTHHMIIHAVPSTTRSRHVAVIMTWTCAMTFVHKHSIQTVLEVCHQFLIISTPTVVLTSAYEWSNVQHLREGNMSSHLTSGNAISMPKQTHSNVRNKELNAQTKTPKQLKITHNNSYQHSSQEVRQDTRFTLLTKLALS